jgi:hypothetical protein
VHINGYPDSAYHTVVGNSPNAAHVSPYGREDSGTKFTVPHDRITRVAFIPNGGNLGGHDAPLSFLEALGYMDGYSIANNSQAQFATTAADYLGRPDAFNPTGRGPDEYKARTWDSYQTTRPMQSHEDRNVNTPVLPAEPLRTRNIGPESGSQFDRSKTDRLDQSGDDQDED